MASDRPRCRPLVWWATLLVAGCAAVATAHGLYAVATACRVRPLIAGVYVPITDGLAAVAYLSTPRLVGAGRRYAWTVVVLAAGLSGLAQAVNLAGLGAPDWRLRFGVGYWPAVATALGLHLLWLVRETPRPAETPEPIVETPEPVSPPAELILVPAETETAPPETPAPRRVSPARQSRPGGETRRCDSGCGAAVSRATYFRHKRDGCGLVIPATRQG